MATLEPTVRSLTEKERRYLATKRAARVRAWTSFWRRTLWVGVVIFGGLGGVTLWLSNVSAGLVVAIWLAIGGLMIVFQLVSEHRALSRDLRRCDDVLAGDVAAEQVVKAKRMWAFEEIEDEGACYAFELEEGGVFFVSGQDYYAGAKFPNSDFSLVRFFDRDRAVFDMLIEKRGVKLTPERVIQAAEKAKMEGVEDGAFFPGILEEVLGKLKRD